jgi:hypothetical protein
MLWKWNVNKCGKHYGNGNLQAIIPTTDYDRSKTMGEFGIFQLFG